MSGNASKRLEILKKMVEIRLVEQYIARRYPEEKMRCPTHLCLGQEATPAVFGAIAQPDDIFVGTYRSHGHYLAKNGGLYGLFAELLGSAEGCSGGFGGSMHIMDAEANFYGTSAIVGGGVPIATGAALGFKYRNEPHVVFCFIGDGALEEGSAYESFHFALLHDLPIIYVCENNQMAVTTPLALRTRQLQLSERFLSLGLAGHALKDSEFCEKLEAMEHIVKKTRTGAGPVLIEIAVDRWGTHVGHEYSGPADHWYSDPMNPLADCCPIVRFVRPLLENGTVTLSALLTLKEQCAKRVEDEFARAESSPLAEASDFEELVYASGLESERPKGMMRQMSTESYKLSEKSKLENPF